MSNNIEQVDIMITIFYTIIGSFSFAMASEENENLIEVEVPKQV
jgi:hypothetical protein